MYRLHQALWPLLEGPSRIDAAGYSPWWGGHQLLASQPFLIRWRDFYH
jgi:hypothetical protein